MVKKNGEKPKKRMALFEDGRFVFVDFPEEEFNFVEYLKNKETEALIEEVSKEKNLNVIRDMTILLLILQAGFRKSSVLSAKWQDIDITDKSILVNYWNRDKSYYVKLNDQIIEYLNHLRKNTLNPCTYIFGGASGRAMSKNQIEKILSRISGYTSYSQSEFYNILRNTFIINCILKSKNINEFFKLTGFSEKNQVRDYVRTFEFNNGFLTGFLD